MGRVECALVNAAAEAFHSKLKIKFCAPAATRAEAHQILDLDQ
ncbi:hypothetical protein [Actinomadura rugatobispora]|uniref:Integrase catalytic domain-containing protein n=1 Tax=Actinomadura rugatobispora TaxID=1994 RepID=A0ABW0ZSL6_9ACTN